ncbi:MAG TPA: CheR family methyltransferase [Kofleriaceae bacterium]
MTDTALRRMIDDATGLSMLDDEVERRLVPFLAARAARTGASLEAYAASLRERDSAEWTALIEAVTNGQTSFFRDREQIELVVDLVAAMRGRSPIAIWCAACATGQEPYTLAMACAERKLNVSILATDINGQFLDRARAGVFDDWDLRRVDASRRARWFQPTSDKRWRIAPELAALVELRRHNLLDEVPPMAGGWRVIMCRNVFLYFRRERIAAVTTRMARALADDGRLVLSAAETLYGLGVPLEPQVQRNRVFYARKAGSAAPLDPPRIVSRSVAPSDPDADIVKLAAAGRLREALQVALRRPAVRLLDHLTIGHLYLRLDEPHEALVQYRQASQIVTLSCEVYYFEGWSHRKAGHWHDAIDAFRKSLFLAPNFWQAAYLLAGCYERVGRTRDSEREHARVRRLLRERAASIGFVSHSLMVDWFSIPEDEARGLLRINS